MESRRKELKRQRKEELAALPFWKKLIAYPLRAIQSIGSIGFALSLWHFSLPGMTAGVAIVIGAEGIYQILTWRRHEAS